MTDPHLDPLAEALGGWLERPGAAPSDGCLDPNDFAALSGGTLLPEERERLDTHLGACKACRELAATAVAATAVAGPAPHPKRTGVARRRPPWIAVTAVAAAAAAALLIWFLLPGRRAEEPVSSETQLTRAFERLARSDPALFAGLRPLDADERMAASAVPERGGLTLLAPRGVTRTREPVFRWADAKAGAASVTLFTDDGRLLWRHTSARSPTPGPEQADPLEAGRAYLWEVVVEGALGVEQGSATFHVAATEVSQRFQAQLDAIERTVPSRLRALVIAHVALRADLLDEALSYARLWVDQHPDEAIGRETAYQIRVRGGDSHAKRALEDQ